MVVIAHVKLYHQSNEYMHYYVCGQYSYVHNNVELRDTIAHCHTIVTTVTLVAIIILSNHVTEVINLN